MAVIKSLGEAAALLVRKGLLPVVIAILPEPLRVRWLHMVSARRAKKAEVVRCDGRRMIKGGQAFLAVDWQGLAAREALYQAVDEVDVALVKFRSSGWFDHHVDLIGTPIPRHGPVLLLTFHFGAGMWAMRRFGDMNLKAAWVYKTVPPGKTLVGRANDLLTRCRVRTVERVTGASAIPTGGAYRKMADWVARDGSIAALIDVPPDGIRNQSCFSVGGRTLCFPNGLARFAVDKRLPVYLYTMALSSDGSRREMRGFGLRTFDDPELLMQWVGEVFASELARDPAAWHFWRFLEAFEAQSECGPVMKGHGKRA